VLQALIFRPAAPILEWFHFIDQVSAMPSETTATPTAVNPDIAAWTGPLGLPDFGAIANEDFAPAFDAALAQHMADIDAIAGNPAAPDFDNTIVALETAGPLLTKVSGIFWLLAGAHTNDAIEALERDLAPKLSRHFSAISMNRPLFERVDALYRAHGTLGLDAEAARVLELTWKGFVRSGAQLDEAGQRRLAEINERLATLGTAFSQNVLADERDWILPLDEGDDLAGLPGWLVASMKAAAEERGHAGKYAVTLSRSIVEPFLTWSERRDLREAAFAAWAARGAHQGAHDNRPIVAEMVRLRAEKAALLGYATYAHYKLDNTMAKTPETVRDLLETVWAKARDRAGEEAAALADAIAAEGRNHAVAPWDWRHYAGKVRTARFDFSENEIKPYLSLDKIIDAAFDTASRLFGLTFLPCPDVRAWHPDVRVFEVLDADGTHRAVFLGDYFARPSKQSGAWMSSLQDQYRLQTADKPNGAKPIIYNVCNFAKAPAGEPVLISMDDAKTLFHEFGHALHGMLSDVTYPSISGTSVFRDFVELPSQLYEHWLTVPSVLQRFARHYETGEPIPQDMLDRMKAAEKFNKGFANVEFTASALVDMAFHALTPEKSATIDPMALQGAELKHIGMPAEIVMRHATPHFGHVFSGDGYSAGYYSYMWSGVLDADAFRAFTEAGDPFDAATAAKLRKFVYASGGSLPPEEAYTAFRGRLPTPDALLEKEGLA
jgi:peptidyl-dipeptidase Dcp